MHLKVNRKRWDNYTPSPWQCQFYSDFPQQKLKWYLICAKNVLGRRKKVDLVLVSHYRFVFLKIDVDETVATSLANITS